MKQDKWDNGDDGSYSGECGECFVDEWMEGHCMSVGIDRMMSLKWMMLNKVGNRVEILFQCVDLETR